MQEIVVPIKTIDPTPIILDLKRSKQLNSGLTTENHDLRTRISKLEAELYNLRNQPKEKEIIVEKVVDNTQINHLNSELTRLYAILSDRDSEIAQLKYELSRPREKEIVVETKTVVDHTEVSRLNDIILELRNRPPRVETREVQVMDHTEVNRLNGLLH